MTKTIFRFFFDFAEGQEKWLNQMAAEGYRLKSCGRCHYTFEPCRPAEFSYVVAFVGHLPNDEADDFRKFLASCGYRILIKNINLNFSFGKVRWRPFAKGWGQVATSPGAFNKELFLIEKKNDGTPFAIYSDISSQLSAARSLRDAYLWPALCVLGLFVMTFLPSVNGGIESAVWMTVGRFLTAGLGAVFALSAVRYAKVADHLDNESKTVE